jgi:hypothetical protein
MALKAIRLLTNKIQVVHAAVLPQNPGDWLATAISLQRDSEPSAARMISFEVSRLWNGLGAPVVWFVILYNAV